MPVDRQKVVEYLRSFDFHKLFIEEIRWDNPSPGAVHIDIKEESFQLNPVAEKRGVHVFTCVSDDDGQFPDRQTRQKIEVRLRRNVHEHLLIFPDEKNKTQIWQWVFRKPAQPARYREYRFEEGQTFEALIQKLESIVINLDDEEGLRLLDVTLRLKDAFDKDRVTKRFYDRFKKQQTAFRDFIYGISDVEDQQWYSAVMLNRLMFIYFVQKKSFLDDNVNYLTNKLTQMQEEYGHNKFYSFYRFFLRRLFHEGLDQKEPRRDEIDRLLGDIPYLNGGIFAKHELESRYPDINIKDEAFEKLFAFFGQYQWHLDDRPLRADNEINPDVLGYIFEKYVNQKELGAYYTKEDITEYISKNTIIPFLFDGAKKECKIAFEGERSVWDLLMEDPDRYIYDAMKKGIFDVGLPSTNEIEQATLEQMPESIAIGLDTSKPNLLDRRKKWNTKTPEQIGLPTEIWRETIARWQRYFEVRAKLENGEVRTINDFITYNLNIRQFAQDVIETAEGPELIRAFYKAIEKVTVLDPTVGSGAFLFAALEILEPLYEACLDRMQTFVDELTEDGSPQRFSDFKKILAKIRSHPNREYFIYKSIIINNLYGVDILDEAVEICKLRLFLKLVAQIDSVDELEPLPDVDFNIRAGNTLVGYTKLEEVKKGVAADLFAGKEAEKVLERIVSQVQDVEALFDVFRQSQIDDDPSAEEFKKDLQEKLKDVEEKLNRYLAGEYGVNQGEDEYRKWLSNHKPFHWFVEFYGILKDGGFDVIIGNPPYIEYSKVRKTYTIKGYLTANCGNTYAYVIERCYSIMANASRESMIVQLPFVCTNRMKPLQEICINEGRYLWFANFDDRPGKLFDGLEHIRATIFNSIKDRITQPHLLTTTYNRWYTQFRPFLFQVITYVQNDPKMFDGAFAKIGDKIERALVNRIIEFGRTRKFLETESGRSLYFHNSSQYWVRAMDFVPFFWNERDGESISSHVKELNVTTQELRSVVVAGLNSSLFYWWFIKLSDCRDLTLREIVNFPIGADRMASSSVPILSELTSKLMQSYRRNSARKQSKYKSTGRVLHDEFFPHNSKPIIDEIDRILAKHYGFSEEELDFVINYDIKYRMGKQFFMNKSALVEQ